MGVSLHSTLLEEECDLNRTPGQMTDWSFLSVAGVLSSVAQVLDEGRSVMVVLRLVLDACLDESLVATVVVDLFAEPLDEASESRLDLGGARVTSFFSFDQLLDQSALLLDELLGDLIDGRRNLRLLLYLRFGVRLGIDLGVDGPVDHLSDVGLLVDLESAGSADHAHDGSEHLGKSSSDCPAKLKKLREILCLALFYFNYTRS